MDMVKMFHPDLDNRVIEVPASSVSEHATSGWQLVDQAETRQAEIEALKARTAKLESEQAAEVEAKAKAAEQAHDAESPEASSKADRKAAAKKSSS